jgi:hypothetical protein
MPETSQPMAKANAFSMLTVARTAERDSFLAESRTRDPFFDTASAAWIVTQPELCKELVASASLVPAPAVETYNDMATQLGLDFDNVIFAFHHIPLCLRDELHAHSRRRTSEFLSTRRYAMKSWMANALPDLLVPFRSAGHFDAMMSVVVPIVRGLISTMIGLDLPADLDLDDISLVFDKSISMRRRLALDASIGLLRRHIQTELGMEGDDDAVGLLLALVILGKDALLGTLGESLYRIFRDAGERRLKELDYGRSPAQTGVPFVERVVVAPISAGGLKLAPGERVRIFLQTFAHSPPSSHHRFFGAGAHACLGRPISTELWIGISDNLSAVDLRPRVLSYVAGRRLCFQCP